MCLACRNNILFFEPEERPAASTHLIGAVSPLWPPSLRPLGGFCQSSWISPRQPCPRRSPYNPWLQTQGRTHKQESASALRVSACQPMPRIPMKQPSNPAHCLMERKKQLIPEFVPTCKKSMFPSGSSRCSKMEQMHPDHSVY